MSSVIDMKRSQSYTDIKCKAIEDNLIEKTDTIISILNVINEKLNGTD